MESTARFSDRVANYVKFRPGYPVELLSFLGEAIGLRAGQVVADVGAGTGISAELLLGHGNVVYAVEPNAAMRAAAEQRLGGEARFHSVAGTGEATGLADGSIDVVTAFQAFHWFEPAAARREFARILKPGGWVVLVWNDRRTGGSAFLEAYEALLRRYGTDYQNVRHDRLGEAEFGAFFGGPYQSKVFSNEQRFEYEGVAGRLLSSSYAPAEGQAGHAEMMGELRRIFDAYNEAGVVRFVYDTRVYWGRVGLRTED